MHQDDFVEELANKIREKIQKTYPNYKYQDIHVIQDETTERAKSELIGNINDPKLSEMARKLETDGNRNFKTEISLSKLLALVAINTAFQELQAVSTGPVAVPPTVPPRAVPPRAVPPRAPNSESESESESESDSDFDSDGYSKGLESGGQRLLAPENPLEMTGAPLHRAE